MGRYIRENYLHPSGKHQYLRRMIDKCEINKETECLEWPNRNWTPLIFVSGRNYSVSRILWMVFHSVKLTSDQVVCHHCDNPFCLNLEHLFLATQADNMLDMKIKRRNNAHQGELNGRAKITENDVRFIRNSGLTLVELSERLPLAPSTIGLIRAGKRWANVC